MQKFQKVLVNTLISSVTSSFLWFALTFWAYLETGSVLATSIVGGSFMLLSALLGPFFGTLVDHYHKKQVMLISSLCTFAAYAVAGILYVVFDRAQLIDWSGPYFWLFAISILLGGVAQNLRSIALSTTVTLLVPKANRDKANGMVGMVQGMAFMVTSVFSGLAIGQLGMGGTLGIAFALTFISLAHLFLFVDIPEKRVAHDPNLQMKKVDLRGSINAIHAVPGLLALIFFSTFNNFIGGAYMALMDPYGLTLFSVEVWGLVLGITSTGFMVGGTIVAKKGLGKNPLKTLLSIAVAMGALGAVFTLREWWWLYLAGMYVYMTLIPAAEAAEQTVIQRVVPYERQGRVFGFAQSVEMMATPITAFAIGPIAQYWIIPYMRSDNGKNTFGWLLGDGDARGIALILTAAGLIMIAATLMAFASKSYKILTSSYQKS